MKDNEMIESFEEIVGEKKEIKEKEDIEEYIIEKSDIYNGRKKMVLRKG